MPENMAPGVVLFDANGDDRLDLYFVQGSPLNDGREKDAANVLFLQGPQKSFYRAPPESAAGDTGYGMGASFGDYDRDGKPDLYITNFGRNALYRNQGGGSFRDVTEMAGVGNALWSTGAAFFDADGDGDLDLFVSNYVDFAFDNHKWCGNSRMKVRSYCHPDVYDGLPDAFYRNSGDGTFANTGDESGIVGSPDAAQAKGLGVVFTDLNGDGHQDIYVANDSTMNHAYVGDGDGNFRQQALIMGLGFNEKGAAEASMGLAVGDTDGDGLEEIFATHLDQETNTLYRTTRGEAASGLYRDVTRRAGLAAPSLAWVGFGTLFLDYDNDGDLDLFVANGHIIDNIELFEPGRSYRQPVQLFENTGNGEFREISHLLGLERPLVGRGAVTGDIDRDGDLDIVLTQNNDRALVLINQLKSGNGSLFVRLRGEKSNREGFGARLELKVGDRILTRTMQSTSSYLSQSPSEVHFGLGDLRAPTSLTVHWPSGQVDRFDSLEPNRLYTLTEGLKEVEFRSLSP